MWPIVVGNLLEWYEYSLYGAFAPVISREILGSESLVPAFVLLAISYGMRPLGAALFGFFADKMGRKAMLPMGIGMMALSTFCIGLIPPYTWIGGWSVALLTVFRVVQGLATGGEYASSAVYLLERAPRERRGLWGALFCSSGYLGFLFGFFVSTLVVWVEGESAWRLPFFLCSLLGLFAFYIRKTLPETEAFLLAQKESKLTSNPLLLVLRTHKGALARGLILTSLTSVSSYLFLSYLPSHLFFYTSLSLSVILAFCMGALLVLILGLPFFGALSDRFGRFPFLVSASLLLGFSPFLFLAHSPLTICSTLLLFALVLASIEGLILATLTHLFSVEARCSGVALSLNVANSLFGGTAPLVASLLIDKTHLAGAPGFYVALLALLCVFTLFGMRRRLLI